MQLALTNVGQTTFGQAKDEEMVRETVDEEEALREKQHPPRRHGGTEEEKGLPRMDADDRGLQGEESSRESEFVPVPGGYGFERVRLGVEPELGGQRRPVQAIIAPECAEVHANLG